MVFRYDRSKTHAEQLPALRADNEAWRDEVLPTFRAYQAGQAARRERVRKAISDGMQAIKASDALRAEVSALTGFTLDAASSRTE